MWPWPNEFKEDGRNVWEKCNDETLGCFVLYVSLFLSRAAEPWLSAATVGGLSSGNRCLSGIWLLA